MAGFLTPDARLRVFSALGVVAPGAKLHAFIAGSLSTRRDTFTVAALTPGLENTNPVVASASGLFGPIYLTKGVAYQFQLTDASDVVIWTQDDVSVPADNSLAAGTGISIVTAAGVSTISTSATSSQSIGRNDFRLTLTSGLPVTVADVTGAATLYCTPMTGNQIDLYDAAGVPATITSAQFSIAVPAVAATIYDVYAYNNAGVATLELLAWTNDTTRATALTWATTGTPTKAGDLTRRYLGTFRTLASGQTVDAVLTRWLWNAYHQVPRTVAVLEATDSWSYTTTTYRQANGAVGNQVSIVVGVAGPVVDLQALGVSSGAAGNVFTAIGENSTTTPVAAQLLAYRAGDGNFLTLLASLTKTPVVGLTIYQWLEKGNTTATFYGDGGGIMQAGLTGTLSGA
jgi:hypothetical protein